jgi:hypothetical protein
MLIHFELQEKASMELDCPWTPSTLLFYTKQQRLILEVYLQTSCHTLRKVGQASL